LFSIKDETFAGTFPFTPHYHEVNGVALHFVDEGSGGPIVLLHGDPTWGYLYREGLRARGGAGTRPRIGRCWCLRGIPEQG